MWTPELQRVLAAKEEQAQREAALTRLPDAERTLRLADATWLARSRELAELAGDEATLPATLDDAVRPLLAVGQQLGLATSVPTAVERLGEAEAEHLRAQEEREAAQQALLARPWHAPVRSCLFLRLWLLSRLLTMPTGCMMGRKCKMLATCQRRQCSSGLTPLPPARVQLRHEVTVVNSCEPTPMRLQPQ